MRLINMEGNSRMFVYSNEMESSSTSTLKFCSQEYFFEGAPSMEAQHSVSGFSLDYSNLQDLECHLCNDPLPFGEGTTIPDCQHSMCLNCVSKRIVQGHKHCPVVEVGGQNCNSLIPTGLLKYVLPENEFKQHQTHKIRIQDDLDLVFNSSTFECSICLGSIMPGDGVVLRDCIHEFCVDCLRQTVNHCLDAQVSCPFANADYSCPAFLQQREVRGVLGDQKAYDKFISLCLRIAEGRLSHTFHCLKADCSGWCVLEDDQEVFWCDVCDAKNCLICQVNKNGKMN